MGIVDEKLIIVGNISVRGLGVKKIVSNYMFKNDVNFGLHIQHTTMAGQKSM